MANPGAFPVDTSTPTGIFRVLTGDSVSQPLDPPVSGQQDYRLFADDEIAVFLTQADDSAMRAAGFAYLQLAGQAAQQAEAIRDYDLQVDSRQKATQLREQAMWYFKEADRLEAASEDGFTIVSTGVSYVDLIDYYGFSAFSPYPDLLSELVG